MKGWGYDPGKHGALSSINHDGKLIECIPFNFKMSTHSPIISPVDSWGIIDIILDSKDLVMLEAMWKVTNFELLRYFFAVYAKIEHKGCVHKLIGARTWQKHVGTPPRLSYTARKKWASEAVKSMFEKYSLRVYGMNGIINECAISNLNAGQLANVADSVLIAKYSEVIYD